MSADLNIDTLAERLSSYQTVAVCWFDPAGWERMLELADDRDRLPRTFAQWEHLAGCMVADLTARGIACERVLIDVDAMRRWCREAGLPIDSRTRASFALLTQRTRDERGGRA